MLDTIEIPLALAHFHLPAAVESRLQHLLDRQALDEPLQTAECEEAKGLVELAEFLSLLNLRSTRTEAGS